MNCDPQALWYAHWGCGSPIWAGGLGALSISTFSVGLGGHVPLALWTPRLLGSGWGMTAGGQSGVQGRDLVAQI